MPKQAENRPVTGKQGWRGVEHRPHQTRKTSPQQGGKKKHVYFRRACNHEYRHTAQQFAITSVRQSAWAATYFNQAHARGLAENQAYRCLANRWLAVIWTLWQRKQLDDETYHRQQIRQHRRP